MGQKESLGKSIDQHLKAEMEKLFTQVPFAREFHAGQATDFDYYRRHIVETVLRIRLNNEVDAYSLYRIGYKNNAVAQKLATYLAEEYGHEGLFLKDLERLGLSADQVLAMRPFFSTDLLIGYLYHAIHSDGPMPTMVWNFFVEWYSHHYNMIITRKAEETFGHTKVQGSLAHLAYDEGEDHVGLMFTTVHHLISSPEDVVKVTEYLTRFVKLVGMYFHELYDATITNKPVR